MWNTISQNIQSKISYRIYVTVILLLLSYIFVEKSLKMNFIQDDAYTSFRYVKNFVEGYGLVFNHGQKVEGYTNFLWVMILSGFYLLNKSGIAAFSLENIAQILSLSFGVASIWVTFFLSNNFFENAKDNFIKISYSLIPSFLIAYSGPMMYWSVSGMETSLFVFLTLLSFLLFIKSIDKENFGITFIVISFLNSLLRPEGLILFSLIAIYKFLTGMFYDTSGKIFERVAHFFNKKIRMEIILFIILSAIYLSFRFFYYGYFLPNTFYAKTEFSIEFLQRGLRYFFDFMKSNLLYGLFLIFPATLFVTSKSDKKFQFSYFIIAVWIILMILIGGDVLPVHRFFLHILPLVFIINIKAASSFADIIKNKIYQEIVSLIFIAGFIYYGFWNFDLQNPSIQNFRSYESGLVKKMKIYAAWINEQNSNTDINPMKKVTVAMSTIGAFSFYANADVIDIVGLTDEYIAHNPKEVKGIDNDLPVLWKERHYNAEYVLSQKPDYIIFPAGAKPSAFAECALFVQDEFQKKYFAQLIYSRELNQLLPIFSKRIETLNTIKISNGKCDVKFVKYYINAINNFIAMTETGNISLMKKIIAECDSVITFCPERRSEAETIKGYTYYHSRELNKAKLYFENSVMLDSMNTISRFYLRNFYLASKDTAKAIKQIQFLKKYSPGIFN